MIVAQAIQIAQLISASLSVAQLAAKTDADREKVEKTQLLVTGLMNAVVDAQANGAPEVNLTNVFKMLDDAARAEVVSAISTDQASRRGT